ncbi:hypothetical protein BC940DRAFT_286917 [Gongronella butleri]|nr:hypothetical protein BC940DRAFT_286917 [Gongronella butleri]
MQKKKKNTFYPFPIPLVFFFMIIVLPRPLFFLCHFFFCIYCLRIAIVYLCRKYEI